MDILPFWAGQGDCVPRRFQRTHFRLQSWRYRSIPRQLRSVVLRNNQFVSNLLLTTLYKGHYVENTSETEKLVWIEIYKSDRIADISLTQWLALTPPEIVATTLNISLSVVEKLKTEKQLIIA